MATATPNGIACAGVLKNETKQGEHYGRKKEKQYVSDNAHLMAEWNWEKNNELGLNPQKLTCGSEKKFGGNAKGDTNGKRRYIIETGEMDVRIVPKKNAKQNDYYRLRNKKRAAVATLTSTR